MFYWVWALLSVPQNVGKRERKGEKTRWTNEDSVLNSTHIGVLLHQEKQERGEAQSDAWGKKTFLYYYQNSIRS